MSFRDDDRSVIHQRARATTFRGSCGPVTVLSATLGCGFLACCAVVLYASGTSETISRAAYVVRLEDQAITPATERFIRQAIEQAESENAQCLIIAMDTPGGLVDSTRSVVKAILASHTPVIVYVSPSGARAASAGVFITLASHVAAMAPGTHIGAAHPVQLGGLPISPPDFPKAPPTEGQEGEAGGQESASPMEAKIVSDTVAWVRALAQLRGRNADWAVRAVRESLSVTASEAVAEGVVDLLAEDLSDLLTRLDGREVRCIQGSKVLYLRGAAIETIEMWWGERLLAAVSDPNIAFLLLILGFYGIMFELYSPGWGVGGTLGVLCVVVAFFGLAVLPVNYAGLLLILLALGLFVAEAFVTSYGLLGFGGLTCLVLGGLMLIDSPLGFMRVSLGVLIPVAAASFLLTVFLLSRVVQAHRKPAVTGEEGLFGAEAVAQEDFAAFQGGYVGKVLVHGELWNAASPTPVSGGEILEVQDRHGLTLSLRPRGR